jgi:hypothetical protein
MNAKGRGEMNEKPKLKGKNKHKRGENKCKECKRSKHRPITRGEKLFSDGKETNTITPAFFLPFPFHKNISASQK